MCVGINISCEAVLQNIAVYFRGSFDEIEIGTSSVVNRNYYSMLKTVFRRMELRILAARAS